MNNTEHTILDYIEDIIVPGLVFVRPVNEYWALICLREGMNYLFKQAFHCDNVVKQQRSLNRNTRFVGIGNLPDFQGIPKALLTCSFHWYAISACNYVRTVGAIAYRQDPSRPKPQDYLIKVIPEVQAFRDKVAAHLAWSTKNKQNNDAERLVSILPQLTFTKGSFHIGTITGSIHKEGKKLTSEKIRAWSICKVHKELQKRYWPVKDIKANYKKS